MPLIENDPLYWTAGWRPARPEIFRAHVAAAVAGAWGADVNVSAVRDLIWARTDTLVWLDYPVPLFMWRLAWHLAWRQVRRFVTREKCVQRLLARGDERCMLSDARYSIERSAAA